jgi:hypothetical protein
MPDMMLSRILRTSSISGGNFSSQSRSLRFVGLVTGITALGAVLASEKQRHFVALAPASILAGATGTSVHLLVSRIVAGDIPGVVSQIAAPAQATMLEVARLSFASGFTLVLLAASAIAALAAILTWSLVSAVETAPHR